MGRLPGPDIKKPKDGGIGITAGAGARVAAIIGLSTAGTQGVIQEFVDPDDARDEYGRGPLPDAICDALANGASSVLGVRLAPSRPGSVVVGTKTPGDPLISAVDVGSENAGTGSVTMSGEPVANGLVEMEVLSPGGVGVATFQYRVDGGAWSEPVTTGAAVALGASGLVAAFADGLSGVSFADGDIFNATGVIDSVGTIGSAAISNPLVAGDLEVEIVTTGGINTAVFIPRIGVTELEARVVQATVELAEFGVTLTFAEHDGAELSFVAGDVTHLALTACQSSIDDIVDAVDLFKSYKPRAHFIYLPGSSTDVAWAIMEAKAEEFRAAGIYLFFLLDSAHPDDFDTPALWGTALLASAADTRGVRVGVVTERAVFADYDDPSVEVVRTIAGGLVGRLASLKEHISPCRVSDGALVGPLRLYPHDAAGNTTVTDGLRLQLDTAGFITGREWDGFGKSVFVTNFRMMAPDGSDYIWGENRRVMDEACRRVKAAAQVYTHAEGDAVGVMAYEKALNVPIRRMRADRMVGEGSLVIVPPGQQVASTSTVRAKVGIVPTGTMRYLDIEIGFMPEESD